MKYFSCLHRIYNPAGVGGQEKNTSGYETTNHAVSNKEIVCGVKRKCNGE